MSSRSAAPPNTPSADAERLALARDPATPPAVLNSLYIEWANEGSRGASGGASQSGDERYSQLGDALAENPNTPPEALVILATSRTAAFVRNPVAPLLTLIVPDLVQRLERSRMIAALLKSGDAPTELIRAIALQAEAPGVREEAELHVALAGELDPLTSRDEVSTFLVTRVRSGREMQTARAPLQLEAMLTLDIVPAWLATRIQEGMPQKSWNDPEGARPNVLRGALSGPPILRCLALAGVTDQDTLERAGQSLVWLERLGVALNPVAPDALPETLATLAEDGNSLVRAAARAACMRGGGLGE